MKYVSLLFALCFAQVALAQNTIGTMAYTPDAVDAGYTLLYPHNQPNVYLVDLCGEVVHTWNNDEGFRPGNVAYLQENGDLVFTYRPQVFANDWIWAGGGGQTVERRTWDNEVLWSYSLNDSTARFHHDIEVKDDGHVFAIAWEHFSADEALAAGRDSMLIPEEGLWSDMILELAPNDSGSADIVWEWHAWDHLVQGFDSTKANFGTVSEDPTLIDLNHGTPSSQASDWLHINAIDFNPFFQHLMVSVPTFNELWIIDYNNFDPGTLLWRWGNPAAYGLGSEEDQQLYYQHDCHWVFDHITLGNPDFGKIAVFNNRVPAGEDQLLSSVHLLNPAYTDYDNTYATDETTGQYFPAGFDWSYTATDSIYSSGLSSFQRLDNGNSLICYGRWGDTREVTPEGELAWRYKTPFVNAGGTAIPVAQGTLPNINQNLTFRAHRYPADYTGFDNAMLMPQGAIELEPMPVLACTVLGCTDPMACNYDSLANMAMNESCIYLELDVLVTPDNGEGDGTAITEPIGGQGGFSFAWFLEGDSLAFATGSSLDSLATGGYSVMVTDSLGCMASADFDIDMVDAVGGLDWDWTLFPNPTSQSIRIHGHAHRQGIFTIWSATGQPVSTHLDSGSDLSLDISGLPAGVYILHWKGDQGQHQQRFQIVR